MTIINELNRIILNKKIPNALLLTGSCGQNKKSVAISFAKSINCLNLSSTLNSMNLAEQNNNKSTLSKFLSCNSCRSCVKIDSKMHPDIITISPESDKAVIKISQIRELCSVTSSKPHEALMRMVMIEDAHTMNQEASNALLKILEEPPDSTFFVLIARELNDILPTIISRCRHLRFKPVSKNQIAQNLIEQFNIEPLTAMAAAKSSNGDIDKAMMFANINSNIDWLKRRKWLFNQLVMFIKPNKSMNEKYLYALILAEKLSREEELLEDSISILKLFLRDIALIKSISESFYNKDNLDKSIIDKLISSELVVNSDFMESILNSACWIKNSHNLMVIESIHKVESRLQTNASVRLVLEQFFLTLIYS